MSSVPTSSSSAFCVLSITVVSSLSKMRALCSCFNLFSSAIRSTKCYWNRRCLSLKILGIETSCDDTGAAVVDENGKILGESLNSQIRLCNKFGGVVPHISQRQHQANIDPVVQEAMKLSKLNFEDLDAIAVTTRPGLVLSLCVGANYALGLCRKYKKPLIKVHHMRAHALTVRWSNNDVIGFPFLCLLASGGHCILTLVRGCEDFLIFGQALDGAPGEAFDKVARRMKLKHLSPEFEAISGGQAIETLAAQGGNSDAFQLPNPLKVPSCNFSFSGLKSFTLKLIEEQEMEQNKSGGQILENVADICASFQHALFYHIAKRVQRAIEYADYHEMIPSEEEQHNTKLPLRTFVISGGVACNQYLRRGLAYVVGQYGYRLICPPPKLCSDNGVMIAWNGLDMFKDVLAGNECSNVVSYENLPDEEQGIWTSDKDPIGQDWSKEIEKAHWKITRKIKLTEPDLF